MGYNKETADITIYYLETKDYEIFVFNGYANLTLPSSV